MRFYGCLAILYLGRLVCTPREDISLLVARLYWLVLALCCEGRLKDFITKHDVKAACCSWLEAACCKETALLISAHAFNDASTCLHALQLKKNLLIPEVVGRKWWHHGLQDNPL